MQRSDQLLQQIRLRLEASYDRQEAQSLAFLMIEHLYGLSRAQILSGKTIDTDKNERLENNLVRLLRFEPLQYILGETSFYGLTFQVSPAVLIPRPETEEVVERIILENNHTPDTSVPLSILDIGTGSGCIAISLKKHLPEATVHALDVSEDALRIAKANADRNRTTIHFMHYDILKKDFVLPEVDILVSNPPYVLPSEKKEMYANVLEHEPHLALFATEEDPLIFYKAILVHARQCLRPGGRLYLEINENFGSEMHTLLLQEGFDAIKIIKDLNEKDRFVSGQKPI
jgi:release factor glutamine methyltransferase